jgi:hypothetical protein
VGVVRAGGLALVGAAAIYGVIAVAHHATAPGPQVVQTTAMGYFKGDRARVTCVPRGSIAPVATWRVPDERAQYLVPGSLCPTGADVDPEAPAE